MIANFAVGRLLDAGEGNYRAVFPAFALIGILGGLVITRIPVDLPPRGRGVAAALRDTLSAFRDRPFITWTVIYSVTTFPFWLGVPAIPVFLSDELRLSYTMFGVAGVVFNGAMLAGFLGGGRLVDRWGSVAVMAAAWTGVGVAHLTLGVCRTAGLAFAAQAVNGVCLAMNDLAWFPAVLEFAPRRKTSAYMGVYVSFYGLRSLIGASLSGVAMRALPGGSRTALVIAGALILPGCLVLVMNLKRLKGQSAARVSAGEAE